MSWHGKRETAGTGSNLITSSSLHDGRSNVHREKTESSRKVFDMATIIAPEHVNKTSNCLPSPGIRQKNLALVSIHLFPDAPYVSWTHGSNPTGLVV